MILSLFFWGTGPIFALSLLVDAWMDVRSHTLLFVLLTDDHKPINGLTFSENIGCTFLQHSLFVADQIVDFEIDEFHPSSLESRKRTDEG